MAKAFGGAAGTAAPPPPKYGGETTEKGLDWDFWNLGDVTKKWTPDPAAFGYEMGVPGAWESQAYGMGQMKAGEDVRAQQMQMMDLLARRARGEDLASEAMAAQQLALGQGAVASQAASAQRGGYDPAAARASMYAQGQMGGQVAAASSAAAAQEQMAAAQAMGQMGTGVRGLDVQQMMGMNSLANQLRQMGMSDKMADMMARMQYEASAKAGYFGEQTETGIGASLAQLGAGALGYKYGGAKGAKAAGDWAMSAAQADK